MSYRKKNSGALGLQCGVNRISLRCIPTHVACSEWGACLTDFRFHIWRQMTHRVKIFENVFPDSSTRHRTTFRGQIWWKSAVAKLPKGRVDYRTKKLGLRGPLPAPFLPKMGRTRQKFPERCHLLTCPRMPNVVRIDAFCVFRKDWFFGPKTQFNNIHRSLTFL